MRVWVAEVHTHVQRLVLVVEMATVLEVCTTEEHDSTQRMSPFYGGVYHATRFTTGSKKRGKRFVDEEEAETDLQTWLRQQ
jgi:hypothetical protein